MTNRNGLAILGFYKTALYREMSGSISGKVVPMAASVLWCNVFLWVSAYSGAMCG